MSQCNEAIEVFFSYSHRDEDLRDELIKHLGLLQRQGVIRAWHDRKIDAGTEWKQAIDTHLQTASIILLLISADFLASDYCYDLEMQRAMARHEIGEARVIPVILRAVDWQSAPFGKLQALPVDGKPVTSWSNRDEAFMHVAQGIRAVAEKFTAKSFLSPVTESITEVSVDNMEIEITIDRDFKSYTEADQDRFLRAVREFLKMDSDLKVKRKRRGSVKITLELSLEQAEKLFRAIKLGHFEHYGAVDAELKAPREITGSTNFASDSLRKPAWYAIQTRSRHEKVVRDQLAAKGIIHLLPLWRKRSVWKDRAKVVEVPLFGGYLFGYFALQDRVAVLETIGVARIVGINGRPVPVPEEQITAVRTMIEQRLSYNPHPYLAEGMWVRVRRGLLAGAEGILIARKQRHRLVIGIDIIQQAVAVDIDSADVEPLESPQTWKSIRERAEVVNAPHSLLRGIKPSRP